MTEPPGRSREPPDARRCDLLLTGGWLLEPDGGRETMSASSVAIDGSQIVDVGADHELSRRWRPRRRIDAGGCVIAPGIVDTHVHLGAFLGSGERYERPTSPSPFGGSGDAKEALRAVARFCSMDVPADMMAVLLRPVLASMLRSGYTGVVDAGGPGYEGAWSAAEEIGIRAAVGPSLADRWHDESGTLGSRSDPAKLLDSAEAFVSARAGGDGIVRPLVSAVDVLGCSDELLHGIASIAERFDVPVHVHSHIGHQDQAASVDADGVGPTERLARAGLLSERTTIMHAGVVSDSDVDAFARAGVTVNHNPVGNAMYGFGVARERSVPRLSAAGVPIVLGSDWTPVVTDPFELMRAALMLHRDAAADDLALSLESVITMATRAGVPLGRRARLGRVEIGQLADLLVIDLNGAHHLASTHPVPAIALHARASDVRTVVVNGRVVVDEFRLTTVDEGVVIEEARAVLRDVG